MPIRGVCNRCGECCQLIALPVPPRWPLDLSCHWLFVPLPVNAEGDIYRFLAARGVQIHWSGIMSSMVAYVPVDRAQLGDDSPRVWENQMAGRRVAVAKNTCPHLETAHGALMSCNLHATADKPVICQSSPNWPEEIALTPSCGYYVEDEHDETEPLPLTPVPVQASASR